MNNWLVGILAFGALAEYSGDKYHGEDSVPNGRKWWQIAVDSVHIQSEAKKRKLSWDQEPGTAGDIATFPSKYGGLMRCENVDHARKSASQAPAQSDMTPRDLRAYGRHS
ncbi:hypothetical protein AK812_SmicGene19586 [Symbiodinium microadriaticum]|uniref:Uncharacterized protein n=1 Tax=Symbiodinium microadriaticum TaxID=2951 RepID=A0A1Q9DS65_SYMMI|nr:hypothetical protein AK812_SmicGene19586 [Symbiodinium microadriaticum]